MLKTFDTCLVSNIVDLYEFQEGIEDDEVGIIVEWKDRLLFKLGEEFEETFGERAGRKTQSIDYP